MKLSNAIISKCNEALSKVREEKEKLQKVLNEELRQQSAYKSDAALLVFLEGKLSMAMGVLENVEGKLEYIRSKALDISDGGDKDLKEEKRLTNAD